MSDTRGVIDEDDSDEKTTEEKKINIYMKDSGNKSSTNIVQIVANSTLELTFEKEDLYRDESNTFSQEKETRLIKEVMNRIEEEDAAEEVTDEDGPCVIDPGLKENLEDEAIRNEFSSTEEHKLFTTQDQEFGNTENMTELFDLPDEMILNIMNKVEPQVLLLCSIIGTGNNRLEQLALDKCQSVDLTFDYLHLSHELVIERFYSHVLPSICNNIQSLTINLKYLLLIDKALETYCDDILSNLKHLKISPVRFYHSTGTPAIISYYSDSEGRSKPLFSIVPEMFHRDSTTNDQVLSFLRLSRVMRTIVSFELLSDCVLLSPPNHEELFFPQSLHLTDVHIAFCKFDDCVRLFYQLGSQLHSLSVTIAHVSVCTDIIMSQMICCPNLKQLTMTVYRNILHYELLFFLLQRLSTVEHLTLLLAIGVTGSRPDHFIDGFDLQRDIISFMPHLRQFNFHIRSILKNPPHMDIDRIRQSFIKQQSFVDCALDYFNYNYGQCQIYSLPFIGTRLDFISNRFPLFDTQNTFSNVTSLLLFDNIKPFESDFFECVARALPRLRILDVFNRLKQVEKKKTTTNLIEFPQLTALILHNIHLNYAEQLLCRSRLPCLVELIINFNSLLDIIVGNNQQARDNCSKVERLQIVKPWIKPTRFVFKFFPLVPILANP